MLARWIGFTFLVCVAVAAVAEDSSESTREPQAPNQAGLWPSDRLMELLITRWADDLSTRHGLSDHQSAQARQAIVNRWTDFLSKHRSEFQPLLNEYFEMRMELEPPDKKRVQAWAGRAADAFKQCRTQVEQTTQDFREVLDPQQRAKFEIEALGINAGLAMVEQRLERWTAGDLETDEFWEPTPVEQRRRETNRVKAKERASQKQPDDQIAIEVASWTAFVEAFIDRYGLDKGQRDAARSCLAELKQRALAHRDRKRTEITRLERRIASHTGTETELEEIKKQLQELYGPIDRMFDELSQRLERIPSQAQHARVTEKERKKKSEK